MQEQTRQALRNIHAAPTASGVPLIGFSITGVASAPAPAPPGAALDCLDTITALTMRPSSLAIALPSLHFWRSEGQHRDMTALYVRTIAGEVALCLWAGSLAVPAATRCVGDTVLSGWNVLLTGWMGAFGGISTALSSPTLR
jgi:hypothetical protein